MNDLKGSGMLAFAVPVVAALLLGGCGLWRTVKVPIDVSIQKSACTADADTLLVMLPGVYSHPDEFVEEGFLDAVAERKLAVDVALVDAHIGYYNDKTIFERLRSDVIAPAGARGYRSIWIVGISIGGFGALTYPEIHPNELAGIVALAPYLGERLISTEIANAGGLKRWRAPAGVVPMEQRLWRRLQRYGTEAVGPDLPPVYLGYGLDDRFAFSHKLLSDLMPNGRVFTTDGGHDWPEWRRLWRSMIPSLPLPTCAR
ncbi:MAG: alpha/beta hydrolase [Variovorax sp.]